MECVSSNCLCGLAQVMPQNWNAVTYNIVLQRDKCGLENVLSKHSLKAIVFCYGKGQTNFTEPAEPIPRMPELQHVSGHFSPPQKKNPHRFPLPFKDTRQWPIALWGYSGSIVRAAFQKKWVIGELRRQTKDLQTRARFGGELPNWWTPYTSVAWWAGNSRQASLVGTSLGKARMLSSGEDLPWGKMPWDKNMMQLGRWRKDTEILSTCCVPGTVRRHFHQFYLRTLKVKHSHSPAESAFFRNKLWQPGSPEPIKQ